MAELVDALDSKSSSFGSVGSIPTRGTLIQKNFLVQMKAKYPLLEELFINLVVI